MKPARKNRMPFLFATLVIWAAISPRFLSASEDWYMKIPPGATRADIREMAGEPLSTKSARVFSEGGMVEFYSVDSYLLKVAFDGLEQDSELVSCRRGRSRKPRKFNSYPDFYYLRRGDVLGGPVQDYYDAGDFVKETLFPESVEIRTRLFPGAFCYPVSDGYLIMDMYIFKTRPEVSFANSNLYVKLLTRDGHIKELYSVREKWATLRPGYLTEKDIEVREQLLMENTSPRSAAEWIELLGKPDAREATGNFPWDLYYVSDGIIGIGVSDRNDLIRPSFLNFNGENESIENWREDD